MEILLCSGPGPHDPADGVLGTADRPVEGMICESAACQTAAAQPEAPTSQPVSVDPGAIDTLKAQVSKATTVAGVRAALLNVLDTLDPSTPTN